MLLAGLKYGKTIRRRRLFLNYDLFNAFSHRSDRVGAVRRFCDATATATEAAARKSTAPPRREKV